MKEYHDHQRTARGDQQVLMHVHYDIIQVGGGGA